MPSTSQLCACVLLCCIPALAQAFDVVAHRGASGYLPEHTLEAVTLAHAQGADFIEQDVVISKDGEAVILHDIHIEEVTDVELKFPDRVREDGRYYAIDFTLEELKRLSVNERQNENAKPIFKNRYFGEENGFTIPTLAEQIELIDNLNRLTNAHVGFFPEIKYAAWHREQGFDISKIILGVLERFGLDGPDTNLYLQSFDFKELQRLRNELGFKGKLVQLIGEKKWRESDTDFQWIRTAEGLDAVAKVADGVAPWIAHLFEPEPLRNGERVEQQWLARARERGLQIYPYTFRIDALAADMTKQEWLDALVKELKVDGIFTDQVPPVLDYLGR
ncbi:glycerophosphodiester phosphodiesterase [Alteromonas aestuariivivens]|uniref:glycerophosphodiester phosphodiesterase n=1 Tax=Alteromonas aestuariivivens TaxID=1938339 RepID=A0A3D8M5Z8_9ALTE|nr:glycerophosphodiester phosphodiesterase [Alteromonas aestuariivivens]RDV25173.1 glycerophosphodiester phosphodiesterase [Alteromonas aestuariivivens]